MRSELQRIISSNSYPLLLESILIGENIEKQKRLAARAIKLLDTRIKKAKGQINKFEDSEIKEQYKISEDMEENIVSDEIEENTKVLE